MNGVRPQRAPRAHRTSSAPLRALAALLAAWLGLSSLAEVAHFMLIPHAVCAEHGELIELSHDSHDAEAHAAAAASEPEAEQDGARLGATNSDEHDHCQALATGQRELLLPGAVATALVPAPSASRANVTPITLTTPTLAPLALAPKTSPPAA